jgi:hypothetical protein
MAKIYLRAVAYPKHDLRLQRSPHPLKPLIRGSGNRRKVYAKGTSPAIASHREFADSRDRACARSRSTESRLTVASLRPAAIALIEPCKVISSADLEC